MADWILKNKVGSAMLFIALALILGGAVWMYVALKDIDQPLIFRFTNSSGISEVTDIRSIILFSLFWVMIGIINSAISISLLSRDRKLGLILTGGTLAISILIFLWFAAIIRVN